MPNLPQPKFVTTVHWLPRVLLESAAVALVAGSLIALLVHFRPIWKFDIGVFVVVFIVEIVFHYVQNRS